MPRAPTCAARTFPPALYASPETLWRSDIDRRTARAHLITISPSGELVGRAIYAP